MSTLLDKATINIFCEERSGTFPWILRRAAEELRDNIPNVTLNGHSGDINYSINYMFVKDVPGIKIGHFTHLEEKGNSRKVFLQGLDHYDYFTCTSKKTRNIIWNLKQELNGRIHIIKYGCDERLKKPIVFGVVGRTYPSGRKGDHLVKMLIENNYNVVSWGKGWSCPSSQFNTWEDLPKFYDSIDYLIVTSSNEGGPVPVIDAIQAGVPVIAPDVGWCWEFPCIHYEVDNGIDLLKVLHKLSNPPTWEDWVKWHKWLFNEVLKNGK